jgi:hypothetical protein
MRKIKDVLRLKWSAFGVRVNQPVDKACSWRKSICMILPIGETEAAPREKESRSFTFLQ